MLLGQRSLTVPSCQIKAQCVILPWVNSALVCEFKWESSERAARSSPPGVYRRRQVNLTTSEPLLKIAFRVKSARAPAPANSQPGAFYLMRAGTKRNRSICRDLIRTVQQSHRYQGNRSSDLTCAPYVVCRVL